MTRSFTVLAAAALLALAAALPARAVDAPFQGQLLRLAEVLGSLHYLRTLCGEGTNQWREQMERLLAAENPDQARRAQLVASFNRGYRSFGVHTSCTASAGAAIARYMREGEELTRDIAVRYGN